MRPVGTKVVWLLEHQWLYHLTVGTQISTWRSDHWQWHDDLISHSISLSWCWANQFLRLSLCSSLHWPLRQGATHTGGHGHSSDIMEPTWFSGSTLARNARDVGSSPAPFSTLVTLCTRIGSEKYQFCKSLVWLGQDLKSWSSAWESWTLLTVPPRLPLCNFKVVHLQFLK